MAALTALSASLETQKVLPPLSPPSPSPPLLIPSPSLSDSWRHNLLWGALSGFFPLLGALTVAAYTSILILISLPL